MMSKELTPLEALEDLRNSGLATDDIVCFTKKAFEKRLDIIENALKDYERRLKLAKEYKDPDNVAKRLLALEIIKEKPLVALVDYKYTYEEWLELVDERGKDLFKNKEEYDLLKEVLK